ncbi:MAG TPA: hypothetical protein VFP32_00660 [Candidatus Saccharimonadales bacterium]|nr:hypothetical protein [Candidatus Saccharimonadales bacterium]
MQVKQSVIRPPVTKPHVPSPESPIGAAVESLISPVSPGSNSSITVHTAPHAKCAISVKYNQVVSTDSGLSPKLADDYGQVSWTWTVDSSAPTGKWPVVVNCQYLTHSTVVQSDLEVVKA